MAVGAHGVARRGLALAAIMGVVGIALAACGSGSTPTPAPVASPAHEGPAGDVPLVAIGSPFTLAPGELAEIVGEQRVVTFVEVASDSRCPTGVRCIYAGTAVLSLEWLTPETGPEPFVVSFGGRDAQANQFWPYVVHVTVLVPEPVSDRAIDASAYRATLEVTVAR